MTVTISAKVPEGLEERIDAAREAGENKSAVIRRLVRAGLEAETEEPESPHSITFPQLAVGFGATLAAGHYLTLSEGAGQFGLALAVVGLVLAQYESVQTLGDAWGWFLAGLGLDQGDDRDDDDDDDDQGDNQGDDQTD